MTDSKPLSRKHQKFVNEYLVRWNGTRAYMAVYPKAQYESAMVGASELLRNPKIAEVIAARIQESQMSADEALKLQTDIARGDITDLLTPLGSIDLDFIREKGLGRLIKKVKVRTITKIGKGEKDDDMEIHDTELEMYPADVAQERVLKICGKFVDRHDITSGGEKIKGFITVTPDDWDKDA